MTEPRASALAGRSTVTWVAAVALLALPVVWLDVYLLSPQEESADYVVGRWSLLLALAGGLALVGERARGRVPWAGLACAVLGWVGVLLGKVVGAGEGAFPWLIAGVAVVSFVAVGMPGAHRAALLRVGVVLALVSLAGVVGLA